MQYRIVFSVGYWSINGRVLQYHTGSTAVLYLEYCSISINDIGVFAHDIGVLL